MMDFKMLIEFARKGIMADIRKHEKTVATGRAYLRALERGEKIKSPLSYREIENVIYEAKQKIKDLSDEEMKLRYNADLLSEDELYKMCNIYKKEE